MSKRLLEKAMPAVAILLLPFALVGVVETVDWTRHLARNGHANQVSELQKVAAQTAATIAPRRETAEQPQ